MKTPVVFLVFNRPESTAQVFAAIREAQPETLLIVADGPRPDRPDDPEKCARVREIVRQVDWDCDVLEHFSDLNLGCAESVAGGISWAFEQVETAIILEDDCLPGQDFFRFCGELIPRYKDDDRVGMINGNNFGYPSPDPFSYHFGLISHIWGWATWRSAWRRYDRTLKDWPEIRAGHFLSEFFESQQMVDFWVGRFDLIHSQARDKQITWDYQLVYTNIINNCLVVTPRENLVTNIGFGPEATHTKVLPDSFPLPGIGKMTFPLVHPPAFIPFRSSDRHALNSLIFPNGVPSPVPDQVQEVATKDIEPMQPQVEYQDGAARSAVAWQNGSWFKGNSYKWPVPMR